MAFWPKWNENKPFALALLILLAFAIVYLNSAIAFTMAKQRALTRPAPAEHTISVSGEGKVTAAPNIATLTLSVETNGADVPSTQTKNTTTVNALIAAVKADGIDAADIQTSNYSINQYWDPAKQTYNGWTVSQTVTVKVRDTQKIATVLSTAGQNGVTNINGPQFTIDDPTSLQAQARAAAIADAQKKAADLASSLGVNLTALVGYSESSPSSPGPIPYASMAAGMGGGAVAPTIEVGTNDIIMDVALTYKLSQ